MSEVSAVDFKPILGNVPQVFWPQAREMGLFGYAIPPERGGLGLDLARDVEPARKFGHATLSLRSIFGTNNRTVGQMLVNFGTYYSQKATRLERMAAGKNIS